MTTSPDAPVTLARLEEILAGCEGVTPGPWIGMDQLEVAYGLKSWEVRQVDAEPSNKHFWPERICTSPEGVHRIGPNPNAAHIARLDPQTVAAIVTELIARRATPSPALLDRACAVEREACAEIAEAHVFDDHALAQATEYGVGVHETAKEIAHAIRARSQQDENARQKVMRLVQDAIALAPAAGLYVGVTIKEARDAK